jgi:hypothetical protein
VEVIVPWAAFCEIAEAFGWDLDEEAKTDLRDTRADLEAKRIDALTLYGAPSRPANAGRKHKTAKDE